MFTKITSWAGSILVGGMFAFTGIFKLTANPDAQATFAQIGGSPAMYFTGLVELIGAALILLPRTRAIGGVLAMGVMGGAIVSHVAGLVPNHDMLPLAVLLFVAASVVSVLHRNALPVVGKHFIASRSATMNAVTSA